MKVVVTFFSCDNGHLNAFDPLKSKDKLMELIETEIDEIGDEWIYEEEITLDDLKNANGDEFIELCESLSSRGHLDVVEI